MKALSIRQPWASLIVHGHKTLETRKWGTPYRGDILICSSMYRPQIITTEHTMLIPWHNWPLGMALGIVELRGVRWMTLSDEKAAMVPWYQDAKAWELGNPRTIEPFPVRGRLGIFDVTPYWED